MLLSLLASPGHVIDRAGTTRPEVLELATMLAAQRDGASVQTDQQQRDRALAAAAFSGHMPALKVLIASGAEV